MRDAAKTAPSAELRRSLTDVAAIALVAAVPLLLHLGRPPLYMWDEARHAINAMEMMRAPNPLIVTFQGEPDLWSPRPPLAAWFAALSVRVGGLSELALRLPSAIAALATVLITYLFARHVARSRVVGLVAALVLLGTGGFVAVHVARTADADALLVLFVTAATFSLFVALEQPDGSRAASRWLVITAAALACAVLTKSIAGLSLIPGSAIYLLASGKWRSLVGSRPAWLVAAIPLSLPIFYYVARELMQPGYLAWAWGFDVVSRFGASLDAQGGPWYYYIIRFVWPWQLQLAGGVDDTLYFAGVFPWGVLLPFAAAFALAARRPAVRHAAAFLLCTLVAFVALISAAATKHSWYLAPACPLIAVIIALGAGEFAELLGRSKWRLLRWSGQAAVPIAIGAALICVALVVWKNEQEIAAAPFAREQRLPYMLRAVSRELPTRVPIRVLSDASWAVPVMRGGTFRGLKPYEASVDFYLEALRDSGRDAARITSLALARRGDVVIACGPAASSPRFTPALSRTPECAAALQR